jgi:hypothetical protein
MRSGRSFATAASAWSPSSASVISTNDWPGRLAFGDCWGCRCWSAAKYRAPAGFLRAWRPHGAPGHSTQGPWCAAPRYKLLILLVRTAGFEPAQGFPQGILSPLRLPFRHVRESGQPHEVRGCGQIYDVREGGQHRESAKAISCESDNYTTSPRSGLNSYCGCCADCFFFCAGAFRVDAEAFCPEAAGACRTSAQGSSTF